MVKEFPNDLVTRTHNPQIRSLMRSAGIVCDIIFICQPIGTEAELVASASSIGHIQSIKNFENSELKKLSFTKTTKHVHDQ